MSLRDPRERHQRLKQTLAEIRSAREAAPSDPEDWDAQAELVLYLKDCRPLLGDTELRQLLAEVSGYLPRTASGEPAVPEALLVQILRLRTDEDIRRALQFRYAESREYLWTPEERVYKEVGGLLGMYLHWCKNNYAPLAFHFWAGVTLIGAVCKRSIYFDSGQYFIRPNWYTFLVGDSATGKSHAVNAAIEIAKRLNHLILPTDNEYERLRRAADLINILPGDSTIPGITKYLSKLRANYRPEPGVDPETGEALAVAENVPVDATCLIHVDELSVLLGRKTFDVEQRAAWLAAMKEGEGYDKLTATDGLFHLDNPAVSLLACCAPAWIKDVISPTILEGGLADRSTYIFRDPVSLRKNNPMYSPFNLHPRDPITAERLAEYLVKIVELPHKRTPTSTPEAEEEGTQIYVRLAEEEDLYRKEFATPGSRMSSGRAFNDILRLSTVLAVSDAVVSPDWPSIAHTPDHLTLAHRLLNLERQGLARFIAASQKHSPEPLEVRLYNELKRLNSCIPRSDFIRGPMRGYRVAKMIPHIRQFMEEGIVEVVRYAKTELWRPPGHNCEACRRGVEVEPWNLKSVT